MRFIDDDGVVLHQQSILLDFRQQDTVRHQLDHGVITDMIAETNFITNTAARLGLQLFRNTVRHGARRQTTRLGMADQPFYPPPQFHTDFG